MPNVALIQKPREKKIAIVGTAPTSEMEAPFSDESWDIYAIGYFVNRYPRVTLGFQIHDFLTPEQEQGHVDTQVPMIVGAGFSLKADHITMFPFEEAKALMPGHAVYLTNTIAYMLAYAILQEPTDIAIYGVDMAVDDDEFFYQQPCCHAWIGVAIGKEIRITIPSQSPLFKSPTLYGRSDNANHLEELKRTPFTAEEFEFLKNQHQERVDQLEADIDRTRIMRNTHHGCVQAYDRMAKTARGIEAGQIITNLRDTAVVK